VPRKGQRDINSLKKGKNILPPLLQGRGLRNYRLAEQRKGDFLNTTPKEEK